jgi:hypothetical protein
MIKENQKILNALFAAIDAAICFGSMTLAFYLHFSHYSHSGYLEIDYYINLQKYIIPAYFCCIIILNFMILSA